VKLYYENIDGLIAINTILNDNGIISDYFISGPPAMIKVFKQKLNSYGVPNDQIKTDDWE